jgi:hypothetical protein
MIANCERVDVMSSAAVPKGQKATKAHASGIEAPVFFVVLRFDKGRSVRIFSIPDLMNRGPRCSL